MTDRLNHVVALSFVLGLRPGQPGWATDAELINYAGHIELIVEDVPLEDTEPEDAGEDPAADLKRRAKELGLRGISKMSTEELAAAVAGAEAALDTGEADGAG